MTMQKRWKPPAHDGTQNAPSGLKIWRLTNTKMKTGESKHPETCLWVAAKTETEAKKYADRVCDDFLPWSVSYAGPQHDNKATARGILSHEKVMALFALPPVR